MSLKKKPAPRKNNLSFWDERRGVIRTRKGGWVPGEAVYNHGYSMIDDFVGKASFFQVLVLNVTGRFPERRIGKWLEATFICMSYPDARIWCNHIGSLAGTLRASSVAGVSAGILATDSTMYGVGPLLAGAQFIVDALEKKKKGSTVGEIIAAYQRHPRSKPIITGYIRPVASGDERIPAMEEVTSRLGFEIGEHLSLAYEIQDFLDREFSEGMNINGYANAFLSDQGYSVQEIFRIYSAVAFAGIQACFVEAADHAPESFFPLRCDDIDYQGEAPRPVPEK